MHICVGKLTSIVSDNDLSPGRRQAIVWTNAGILLIWPSGTNFNETLIEIHAFSFKKMHLKMSSRKWRPFYLRLNVLIVMEISFVKLDPDLCATFVVAVFYVISCYVEKSMRPFVFTFNNLTRSPHTVCAYLEPLEFHTNRFMVLGARAANRWPFTLQVRAPVENGFVGTSSTCPGKNEVAYRPLGKLPRWPGYSTGRLYLTK